MHSEADKSKLTECHVICEITKTKANVLKTQWSDNPGNCLSPWNQSAAGKVHDGRHL